MSLLLSSISKKISRLTETYIDNYLILFVKKINILLALCSRLFFDITERGGLIISNKAEEGGHI